MPWDTCQQPACTWGQTCDKDLARKLWGFCCNIKSFDADRSTRTHHNLSMNISCQTIFVTFVACQEKQWLWRLASGTEPLASILFLHAHLGLAMTMRKMVLPKHQKAQSKESCNVEDSGKQPCQKEIRRNKESDVSWQCHVMAGNASSSLACQSEKIPLRKVGRISLS